MNGSCSMILSFAVVVGQQHLTEMSTLPFGMTTSLLLCSEQIIQSDLTSVSPSIK